MYAKYLKLVFSDVLKHNKLLKILEEKVSSTISPKQIPLKEIDCCII